MTPRPITIEPSQTVAAAASIMRTCRVRHLPVVSPGLVGMLSIADVIAAADGARVGDVMDAAPERVAAGTSLASACGRMIAGHRSCLPVVDGAALVGIFAATDALPFATLALEADARTTGHAQPVAQLMTAAPIVTVAPTSTLASAWQTMRAGHGRHLLVAVEGRLVGILSDRDVLAAGRGGRGDEGSAPATLVGDAMSTRLATTQPERPAAEAAATLVRRRVGALAVLDDHELRGMITAADFLHWILAHA